jgi:hypothetical protein
VDADEQTDLALLRIHGFKGATARLRSRLVIGVVQAKLDALRSAIVTGDIPQNVNFAISLEVLADFLTKDNVGPGYPHLH